MTTEEETLKNTLSWIRDKLTEILSAISEK